MYIRWSDTKCNAGTTSPTIISTEVEATTLCSNDPNCKAIYSTSTNCMSDFIMCNDAENLIAQSNECVQEKIMMSSKIKNVKLERVRG